MFKLKKIYEKTPKKYSNLYNIVIAQPFISAIK